jgi:hypothetical protein
MHPKAYVGIFKHPIFFEKEDWLLVNAQSDDEYRSDDYYYVPVVPDMHSVEQIDR